jgi:hypothetical protein
MPAEIYIGILLFALRVVHLARCALREAASCIAAEAQKRRNQRNALSVCWHITWNYPPALNGMRKHEWIQRLGVSRLGSRRNKEIFQGWISYFLACAFARVIKRRRRRLFRYSFIFSAEIIALS